MSACPPPMFSASLAAAGIGKLVSFPLTETVLPAMGAPVVGTGAETIADALWLGPAELVPAELAAGVPDEHAATDRLAAQAVRASAAERYLFIRFLYWVHKSQVPTLNAPTIRRARFDRE